MPRAAVDAFLHTLDSSRGSGDADTVWPPPLAALELDGLALSLVLPGGATELVQYSDERTAALEDVQYVHGQGPTREAAVRSALVLVSDLVRCPRWIPLPLDLLALDVRAVLAFPLRVGGVCLGALTGHRARTGLPDPERLHAARHLAAGLALRLLSDGRDGRGGRGGGLQGLLLPRLARRSAFHQAVGMVAVQLGVAPAEAQLRIRAHAFEQGRPLVQVADNILARRLHLDDDH